MERGKPITPNQLARLLKPFQITPTVYRFEGRTPRGYTLDQFEDAFQRYLPPDPPTSTATPQHASRDAGFREFQSATALAGVAVPKSPESASELECCGVAVGEPGELEI